ncbi:MAG: patatin family protein [Anaerorhabdus sp.]
MNKIGLVLEGGGMRGAYTAGALAWLIDNKVDLDYHVGISAGAVHVYSYLLKNKDFLHDISVKYMSDKRNVGLVPLLKEKRYVGYDYMFDDLLLKQLNFDISSLKKQDTSVEIGIYDLSKCETLFFSIEEMDNHMRMIKAACTLPVAGRIVDYSDHRFLDGGISVMIPIERSIEMKNNRHLIIITKPEGYVRKAAGKFMQSLMKFNYPKYPKLVKHYTSRHESYNRQMDLIQSLVQKEEALLVRPSQTIPVKRFSGDPENLEKLYQLGYSDMENRKEEILNFIKR